MAGEIETCKKATEGSGSPTLYLGEHKLSIGFHVTHKLWKLCVFGPSSKKNSRRPWIPASTVRASCLASPRFWQGVLMERVCASPALVGDDRNLCPARNTCQCGYLLIIRRIANLDEEAEVVLDPILMPLLHLDLALITCNRSPAHFWEFLNFSLFNVFPHKSALRGHSRGLKYAKGFVDKQSGTANKMIRVRQNKLSQKLH